jgi:catechol 2,3-dioxygenase-like lactoylglutathione lyase family enzyme
VAAISAPFPTLPASDLERARKFYESVLHFPLSDDQLEGGLLFDVGGGQLWVYQTPTAGTAQSTAAAWFVDDLAREVAELERQGVRFETFDAPDATWDGVILDEGELRSAWFRDSEDNILCIDERVTG